jgi:DNA-binding Lrp family transcriptional regulator
VIFLTLMRAFELIRARTGKEERLMAHLMKLQHVRETHLLTGKWDVMATLAFETLETGAVDPREDVLDLVTGKIRRMTVVRDTSTIVPAMSLMRERLSTNPRQRGYAFVFMSTKLGKEREVMSQMMNLEEVAESHLLLGKSDVLAVLHFERGITPPVLERVARIVTEKIGKTDNVVETQTLCPIKSIIKQ